MFDPLLLARFQFAFTMAFHILFPAFTIGLASWLVVLEALYLWRREERHRSLYQFWNKVFAISFGMGVVSGIVMSYQFGTNWSRFSDVAGPVIGPLMAYEVLTAFFLEATFLGVMLFGWDRVPRAVHFLATCAVALGTLLSAFWILSANSWMHTPAGYTIRDGIFHPVDWWAIVFNPSFPYRFVHMVFAAYLTTAFAVIGVAARYLLRGHHVAHARSMLAQGLGLAAILAPLQIVAGDLHGLNSFHHQPAKVAAIEGHWETHVGGAPLVLFALPDQEAAENRYAVEIPKLGSLILTHSFEGRVPGLKEWPRSEWPRVALPFWAFRLMVGIGLLMAFVGLFHLWLRWRGRLYTTRWFLRLCALMLPAGFIAVLAGWVVTETGRQPYVVYGLMRTAEGISPVPGGSVAASLAAFVLVYGVIFGAGIYYIARLISRGPEPAEPPPPFDPRHRAARPLSAPDTGFEAAE